MDIIEQADGSELTLILKGRLNTNTAPQLEHVLETSLDGVTALTLDLTDLDYISSAGLRLFMTAQKTMNRQGTMVVRNVKPEVYDVFEMTGFVDFLSIA